MEVAHGSMKKDMEDGGTSSTEEVRVDACWVGDDSKRKTVGPI